MKGEGTARQTASGGFIGKGELRIINQGMKRTACTVGSRLTEKGAE